jgi:hypothetical protein
MGFVCGDARDLIVSYKNDHGPSHQRYRPLQWYRRLKISFCEIFGVVRFSTFATLSAPKRTFANVCGFMGSRSGWFEGTNRAATYAVQRCGYSDYGDNAPN